MDPLQTLIAAAQALGSATANLENLHQATAAAEATQTANAAAAATQAATDASAVSAAKSAEQQGATQLQQAEVTFQAAEDAVNTLYGIGATTTTTAAP